MQDSWTSGTAYERFMGRWSKLVAIKFLRWLATPPGLVWLDVGCGTGSLTRLILDGYQPLRTIGIDASQDQITEAQRVISNPDVSFKVGLAQALELDSNSIDVVVSGLVLNFVPQPEAAVMEMMRVTRPGGTIGIYIWDYTEGMQMLRYFWDAAGELDPAARGADEGIRFPICRAGQLEILVKQAGLRQVESIPIEVSTVFKNFDDFWQPFLGHVGPASHYVLSLNPGDRQRLAEKLQKTLPLGSDGSISLLARAWAVKGTVAE